VSSVRRPSLAEQGRQLAELQARILEIHDDAALRAHAQPQRAQAYFARAEAEAAPLVAQGARLRDELIARARLRARRALAVAWFAAALIVALVGWLLLQR
jgi:hypothetical protein